MTQKNDIETFDGVIDDVVSDVAKEVSELPFVRRYGYSILLTTLVLLLVVGPVLSRYLGDTWMVIVMAYLTFLGALLAVSANTGHFKTMLVLVCFACLFDMLSFQQESVWMSILAICTDIMLYSYLGYLILKEVILVRRNITFDMINGAICVYLLIGITFAYAYILMQMLDPASFAGVKFIDVDSPERSVAGFMYFSFVTLTTLGYGDISPNTIEVGSFVFMETIIGQVYMTVLVARLVGLHISQNNV